MFIELLLKKFQALSRTWGYRGRQEKLGFCSSGAQIPEGNQTNNGEGDGGTS